MAESGPFGPAFEPPALDDWLAVIERDLRGASFDERLVRRGLDGLETRPLYTAQDLEDLDESGWPGQAPWTRGRRVHGGWKAVQLVRWPELRGARRHLAEELTGGADGVLLRADVGATGSDGVRLALLSDLRALLDAQPLTGKVLALAPGAHFLSLSAALSLCGLPEDCTLHLGADPVAVLAETGQLPGGSRALGWLGDLAAWARRALPQARTACVHTGAYHLAGATEVDDLAIALATGVTYLRAMTDAGLSVEQALEQLVFRVPLDTEMLGAVSKIRALRRLWGRVSQACGVGDCGGAGAVVHVLPASRRLTVRDPWVNLLRNTVVTFAGACAGAELISTLPFDGVEGQSDEQGRRQARNTQLVLALESHLGRVADPAGGAFFFEERTEALARAAWARFQELEAAGGIVPALEQGLVQGWLANSRQARADLVARRKLPITGVSEFPRLDEQLPQTPSAPEPGPEPAAPELGVPPLPDAGTGVLTQAIARCLAGTESHVPLALFTELAEVAGAPIHAQAVPAARLAAAFEALRGRADDLAAASGARPTVFLATLGRLAEHTGRTTYTGNLVAAGGLGVVEGPGGDQLDAVVRAFADSGARVAVLCSSDGRYGELAVDACAALKQAGARQVWLAGRPRALAEPLAAAGLTGALHLGCDVLAVLQRMWQDAVAAPQPGPEDT